MAQATGYITLNDVSDGTSGFNNATVNVYRRQTAEPTGSQIAINDTLQYVFADGTSMFEGQTTSQPARPESYTFDITDNSGTATLFFQWDFMLPVTATGTELVRIRRSSFLGPTNLAGLVAGINTTISDAIPTDNIWEAAAVSGDLVIRTTSNISVAADAVFDNIFIQQGSGPGIASFANRFVFALPVHLNGSAITIPAGPSGVFDQTTSNGWSTTIPTGSDQLWFRQAQAIARGSTDTVATTEWSNVIQAGTTGTNGQDGRNQATAYYFRRTTSDTAPVLPTSDATYNFTSGTFTPITNNNWSTTIPDTGGDFIWIIAQSVTSLSNTGTLEANGWSAPAILSQRGETGDTGRSTRIDTAYFGSADGSISALYPRGTITGNNYEEALRGGLNFVGVRTVTWTDTEPAVSTDPADYTITQLTGDTGLIGATGPSGTDGVDATEVAEGIVYFTMAQSTAPDIPTATDYNFTTGVFTDLTENWQTTPTRIEITRTDVNHYSSRWRAVRLPTDTTATITFQAPIAAINFGVNIQSDNFVQGSAGWRIERDTGNAEFDNLTIRDALITQGRIEGANISGTSISGTNFFGTFNGTLIGAVARLVNGAGMGGLTTNNALTPVAGSGTITTGSTIVPSHLLATDETGAGTNRYWDQWIPFRVSFTSPDGHFTTLGGTNISSPQLIITTANGSATLQPFANSGIDRSALANGDPEGVINTAYGTTAAATNGNGIEVINNANFRLISRFTATVDHSTRTPPVRFEQRSFQETEEFQDSRNDGGTVQGAAAAAGALGNNTAVASRTITLPIPVQTGDTITISGLTASGGSTHGAFGGSGLAIDVGGQRLRNLAIANADTSNDPNTGRGFIGSTTGGNGTFTVNSSGNGSSTLIVTVTTSAQFNQFGMDDDPGTNNASFTNFTVTTVQNRTFTNTREITVMRTVEVQDPDVETGGWTSRDSATSGNPNVTFDSFEVAGFIRFTGTQDLTMRLQSSTSNGGTLNNPTYNYTTYTWNWAPNTEAEASPGNYPRTDIRSRFTNDFYDDRVAT